MKALLVSISAVFFLTLAAQGQAINLTGTWKADDNTTLFTWVQSGKSFTYTNNFSHTGAGYWTSNSSTSATAIQTLINSPTGCTVDMSIALIPVTSNQITVNYEFLETQCGAIAGVTGQTTMRRQAVTTVNVGELPTRAAVNPLTNKIYISNRSDVFVTMIDGANFNTANISTAPSTSTVITVNPVTNKIYATNNLSETNNLSVINGNNNSLTTLTAGTNPTVSVVNTKTNTVYIANPGLTNPSLIIVNGCNDSMAPPIPLGFRPVFIAIDEAANKIYLPDLGGNTVTIMDANNNNQLKVATVGQSPGPVAVNTASSKTYVASSIQSGTVSVINSDNSAVPNAFTAGVFPSDIAANPTTSKIYVANRGSSTISGSVTIINEQKNLATTLQLPGKNPVSIAIDTAANLIYLVSSSSNDVTVLNGTTDTVLATIPVGSSPLGVSVNSLTHQAYVVNTGSDNVSIIDGNMLVPGPLLRPAAKKPAY